jgi:hypothetical protein
MYFMSAFASAVDHVPLPQARLARVRVDHLRLFDPLHPAARVMTEVWMRTAINPIGLSPAFAPGKSQSRKKPIPNRALSSPTAKIEEQDGDIGLSGIPVDC